MYENPTLKADVIFPDFEGYDEPLLTPQGVKVRDTGAFTPYNQTVAYIYNKDAGTLKQLSELPVELVSGAESPIQLGTGRVLSKGNFKNPIRRLVEQ
jgi:hypothetical protein